MNRNLLKARAKRFKHNQKKLNQKPYFENTFPSAEQIKNYPRNIQQIYQFYKTSLKSYDLVALSEGKLYSEKLIDLYFVILEKINSVLLEAQKFLTNQTPMGGSEIPQAERVYYCNSNFMRRFRKVKDDFDTIIDLADDSSPMTNECKDVLNTIKKMNDSDIVLVPFFFDDNTRSGTQCDSGSNQTVLVQIRMQSLLIDLFDRPSQRPSAKTSSTNDTHSKLHFTFLIFDICASVDLNISEEILSLLEVAFKLKEEVFSQEDVDGGCQTVCVENEEDYLVAMAYIAEC